MPEPSIYYRRNLPHIHPEGYPFFITFNLVDSLPREVVAELEAQRKRELQSAKDPGERYQIQKKYFGRYDEWLDRCQHGHRWLESENISHIVVDEIHKENTSRYILLAYCIMPNHVHLLIESLLQELPHHKGKSAISPISDTMPYSKAEPPDTAIWH